MSIAYLLPDGAELHFDQEATGLDIAERISKRLAKQALAVRVNGELKDVYLPVTPGAKVEIVTRDDDDALELIRHDAAHVMAEAVQELFPDTQVTIGPTIENRSEDTRLNSSHVSISYAVFCLKKKKKIE